MEVYAADGTHLGGVKEVRGTAFKVNARLAPDYWLSVTTVQHVDGDRVTLSFNNDTTEAYRLESAPDD
jgi:hypothetical protein